MMDLQTEQFFNLWNIHAFADFHFLRSHTGREWFRELRRLAADIPSDSWRKYARWLVDESQSAVDREDAHQITDLSMNAFENQMRLIWRDDKKPLYSP